MEHTVKGNKKYKDTLFKFLFGNPKYKEFTLSLYNAMNNSHYTNAEDIQINTLEDAIYIKMKNDVSFIFNSTMCLYEQQSTFNPNMAYRMLEYVVALFQNIVSERKYNKYGHSLFTFPAPRFVVFYNGFEKQPEFSIQKLSDMFEEKTGIQLELIVEVYNINRDNNSKLLNSSKPLNEYMWFVNNTREYTRKYGYSEEIIAKAYEYAISKMPDSYAIKPILEKEYKEVISMLFEEYNEELYRKAAEDYANEMYQKGKNNEKIDVIRTALAMGMSVENMSQLTRLPKHDVEKIINSLK